MCAGHGEGRGNTGQLSSDLGRAQLKLRDYAWGLVREFYLKQLSLGIPHKL